MSNVILSDASASVLASFNKGLEETTGLKFDVEQAMTQRKARTPWRSLMIQFRYFTVPLGLLRKSSGYYIFVGWQQFFAINLAFWKCLFRMPKRGTGVVFNFTYKKRGRGLVQKLYHKYMTTVCRSAHVDMLHVPSYAYADEMSATLGVDRGKFFVTNFGIEDEHDRFMALPRPEKAPQGDYTLAVGRSNRDFDLIAGLWARKPLQSSNLVIISDTWTPKNPLPANVMHIADVTGAAAEPWFTHAAASVVPVAHPNICSGDTVLLRSMMLAKPTIITAPSTLAEMYVENGVDGMLIGHEGSDEDAAAIARLLADGTECERIGANGRRKFLDRFTLRALGRALGLELVRRGL